MNITALIRPPLLVRGLRGHWARHAFSDGHAAQPVPFESPQVVA